MSRRQARDQITELARELAQPRRANFVLAAYRWRYEIATAVLVPLVLVELDRAIGPVWLGVLLAGVASMTWHWRAARRFVLGRFRAVVVQHRLRTAFARARVCTPDGRTPAIVWTSPKEDEIRVLVSCPAGVGVDRLHQQRELLAAACFATQVGVTRHPRHANLVVLSVRTAA
ncbi:MAG TPA: hypothetical protein VHV49_16585 [Pseudonocardiaceae bacterium]|nr:hypothetical protein [Pseudonocardiaceae bacterium]